MSRPVWLMVVCAVLVCGVTAATDVDPVEKKLAAAKEEYEKAAEKARAGLLADLKKKEETAQKAGDLKTLEKVQAEAKAFGDGGVLPKTVPVKAFESQMRTARARLEEGYGAAVKQYTKDGKIALAKTVQQELDEFKGGLSRPADAAKVGDKYYKVFDTNLTWHEAKRKCELMGGRLAAIDSAEENEFVTGLVKKSPAKVVWLGATNEKKKGEWLWVSGKKVTYTNWEKTQPNDKGAGYLVLLLAKQFPAPESDKHRDGEWFDWPPKSDKYRVGFVCMWE